MNQLERILKEIAVSNLSQLKNAALSLIVNYDLLSETDRESIKTAIVTRFDEVYMDYIWSVEEGLK